MRTEATVSDAEFARHLGYPNGRIAKGEPSDLAAWARDWFAEHATPYALSSEVAVLEIPEDRIILADGSALTCRDLALRFRELQVECLYVLAVTCGGELDREIQNQWALEHPARAFTLNAYASAYTETLLRDTAAKLCLKHESLETTLLTPFSPGYERWDLSDQHVLQASAKAADPDLPIEVLPSALLVPQKSLLSVMGIARLEVPTPPGFVPCETCTMNPCHLRRAPYIEGASNQGVLDAMGPPKQRIMTEEPKYEFREKALKRWRDRCVEVEDVAEGVKARFRFDGSTCSDGGVPLAFDFEVSLEKSAEGYLIRDAACRPAEGDAGYKEMCSYKTEPEAFMGRIAEFKPLLGEPLDAALRWTPARNPAGCLCAQSNRNHKWLIVLQTIHYALAKREEGVA